MYGMEVVGSNRVEEEKWERIQDKMGRVGLRANRYVAREAIRGEMGWSTFNERISKAKGKFKLRLEEMAENRWPKKVYKCTSERGKWNREVKRRIGKVGISQTRIGEGMWKNEGDGWWGRLENGEGEKDHNPENQRRVTEKMEGRGRGKEDAEVL